jgi:hypothetical protein
MRFDANKDAVLKNIGAKSITPKKPRRAAS